MKQVLLLSFLLSFSLNAALSGLQELVDTYNPDATTDYWKAIGTPLERSLAHITLKAITRPSFAKQAKRELLIGFLKNLGHRKRFTEFTKLIEELEQHGLRMLEELTLPVPKQPQTQLPCDKPSLSDFDDCN
jgi:hypothetical protein